MRDTRPLTCFPRFRPLILTFVVLVAAFVVVFFFFFFAMTVSSRLGPLKSFKVFGPFRRVRLGVLIDPAAFSAGTPAWGRCAAKLADQSLPAHGLTRYVAKPQAPGVCVLKVVRGAISAQRLPSTQMAGSS